MRLFISIQLSEDMRDVICGVQLELKRMGVKGNYVPRENLHLTLAFIGEYSDPEPVLDILDSLHFEPFELTLKGGIGCFGDLWWIGLEQSKQLQGYVRRLRHVLAEAGIPFDRKRFSPHITVLRRADIDLSKLPSVSVGSACMIADHASLMRSDRGKCGMIYSQIR